MQLQLWLLWKYVRRNQYVELHLRWWPMHRCVPAELCRLQQQLWLGRMRGELADFDQQLRRLQSRVQHQQHGLDELRLGHVHRHLQCWFLELR